MKDDYIIHSMVEMEELDDLRKEIESGIDVEVVHGGLSLLQHALDVEIAGIRAGNGSHVDVTALLLSAGADPFRKVGRENQSALEMAEEEGHWLAAALFRAWGQRPA
ncbi:ankyrin repeat domain-containing protein [Actinoplanes palleronii]|uniref:Ankyrin repeat protein n=1 Tax=Actinoplanes palleronii TaxID=113570 RepID=A0ABQ4BS79_9ACTN|nr:ankyrin repeat domain-containing protein [Actinoplanes palleronii]GIE73543.1 hypothetical protein Apa02nite_096510 [Actinoplanes palleronii]